jgi:hypothetical protein
MLGLVQSRPLLISEPIDYASTWHGRSEIVSRDPEGAIHRSNYAEVATRQACRERAMRWGLAVGTASRRSHGTAGAI